MTSHFDPSTIGDIVGKPQDCLETKGMVSFTDNGQFVHCFQSQFEVELAGQKYFTTQDTLLSKGGSAWLI